MRYDAEHKQKTRERVLTEAAKAIRAEGPHRIAVAGVMSRAGLTHGGFYAHFASKEELVSAAIDQMFAEGYARWTAVTGDLVPAEALVAYVDFYLSAAHRDSRTTGCPLPYLSADLPRLPEDARRRFGDGVRRLTIAIAGLLAQLGRPHPREEASSVLSELVGALSLARAEPDPKRSDVILASSRRILIHRLGLSQ